jgi:hypothetical protein
MKKVLIGLFFLVLINNCSEAQDDYRYLLKKDNYTGYLNDFVIYGSLRNDVWQQNSFPGLSIGIILHGNYKMGIIGMGNNSMEKEVNNSKKYISSGFGGFSLGYIFLPKNMIHFETELNAGYGSVIGTDMEKKIYSDVDPSFELNSFYVSPSFKVEINVTRFMRINMNVGYSFVNPENSDYLDSADLSGIKAGIELCFGNFGKSSIR